MAAQPNGRPTESKKVDNRPNGRPNGHIPYQHTSPNAPSASFGRRVLGLIARLAVWYTIITTLFRCPSSVTNITSESPRVCRPYLITRSYIDPYTKPYYDQYALPYVDLARPYAEKFEQTVYTPAVTLGKQSYDQYGAPRVRQASDYGQLQWEKSVKPVLESTQSRATTKYNVHLAPHIHKAKNFGESYYTTTRENALRIYNLQVLPAYTTSRPYLEKAYLGTRDFAVRTGLPYVRSAWTATVVLFERTVWPQLRVIYGKNIEPQLVRIGERLGRYRDGKKLEAAVKDIDISSDSASFSSTVSSLSSSVPSATATESTDAGATTTSEGTTSDTPIPKEEDEETREKIANDLKNWQEKFAKAADKGTEDLEQRVKEITDRQIENQIKGLGGALIIQLEEAADSEVIKLRKIIMKLVKRLPEEPTAKQYSKAEEELSNATKKAGAIVKDKAQSIRDWKDKFDGETQSLVSAASESTLEVIDNIRDLGLQEIGMRWAWMEGVTYKDWSKYHSVKKTFDEWRQEVEVVATDHDGLQKAFDAARDLESRGMSIAEDTAKELRRLKEVGIWKIQSADRSDDFSTKYISPGAAKQGQKVMKQASSASGQVSDKANEAISSASSVVVGTDPGYVEQASSNLALASDRINSGSILAAAKEKGSQVSAQASDAFIGSSTPVRESVVSGASKSLSSASSVLSQKRVYGGAMAQVVKEQKPILDDLVDEETTYSKKMQSIIDQAGIQYADVTRAVSEALFQATKTQGTAESVTSVANEQYSKALEAASSVLYGTQQDTAESVTSLAAEQFSMAVSAASSAMFGTPVPATASIASQASSAFAQMSKSAYDQYNQAKSAASAQISGEPIPIQEAAMSSIGSAYSGSMQAASDKMESLMNMASTAAYGTGMSPQESALSLANSKYSQVMASASSQLKSAKIAMGKSSTKGYESFLSEATQRYSSLVAAADSSRASASKAYYGPSQGVLESISAIASSRLADSLGAASAQYSNVKAQVGATPTPAHQQYLNDGQRRYYEAVGLAHQRYSDFLTAASSAVYGTPTPTLQGLYSSASGALLGTPTPSYQGVLEGAQFQYNDAVSKASESLNAVLNSASSAVGKTSKHPAQNVLDSASSSYSAALAAASETLLSLSSAASTGIYGSQTGIVESVISAASDKASSISATASSQVAGETPWSESVASQASQNWEILVSKASEQIYGAPTPWSESVRSQAGGYAAQATDGALAQYEAVQALFKEVVSGKEPDFTESVMNRLSAAYYTGAHVRVASSASSFVGDSYASASSVVSTIFTPPASLEAILQAASDQVNAAVDAASQQYYGSKKSTYEQVTSRVASSYSTVSAKASEGLYGTQPGVAEQIQSSLEAVASSAQNAISQAIYGSTAPTDSAASVINSGYASVSSAVQDNMASATSAIQAKVSEAIYGPEKGAVESASLRLQGVIESAKARLAALPKDAQGGMEAVQSGIEDAASSVSSMASKATDRIKDEL
ncbi:MAG: hypothetical protein Q9209_001024 [Squamulea sp. 1 TL-2023]